MGRKRGRASPPASAPKAKRSKTTRSKRKPTHTKPRATKSTSQLLKLQAKVTKKLDGVWDQIEKGEPAVELMKTELDDIAKQGRETVDATQKKKLEAAHKAKSSTLDMLQTNINKLYHKVSLLEDQMPKIPPRGADEASDEDESPDPTSDTDDSESESESESEPDSDSEDESGSDSDTDSSSSPSPPPKRVKKGKKNGRKGKGKTQTKAKAKSKSKAKGKSKAKSKVTVVSSDDEDSNTSATPGTVRASTSRTSIDPKEAEAARDKLVAQAAKHFVGFRVLEPDKILQRNQAMLASYLGLKSGAELGVVMQDVQKTIVNFMGLKNRGFDVPNCTTSSTFTVTTLVREISKGPAMASMWRRLCDVKDNPRLSLLDPCFVEFDSARKNKTVFPRAVYIAQIYALIKQHPELFPESHSPDVPDDQKWGVGTPDDVHRALCLLRFGISHFSAARTASFPDKPAAQIRYLTDEEMDQLRKGKQVSSKADAIETLRRDVTAFFDDHGYGPDRVGKADIVTQGVDADLVAKLGELGQNMEESMTSHAGRKTGKDRGGAAAGPLSRPPITTEEVHEFLRTVGNQVEVCHDAFIEEEPVTDGSGDPVSLAEQAGPIVDGRADEGGAAMAEHFWALRSKMSTVSAPAPSYSDAAQRLGFDPDSAHHRDNRIYVGSKTNAEDMIPFVPKLHQTIGAAWQLNQEDSPLRGGILANDCGLGKTSQIFLTIHRAACEQVAQAEANKGKDLRTATDRFRPTLILAPPNLISVWLNELRRLWTTRQGKPALKVRVFYGSDRDAELSDEMRTLLLPSKAEDAKAEILHQFPADDPRSAFGVVLSAYDTLANRTLRSNRKSREEKLRAMSLSSKDTDFDPAPEGLRMRKADTLTSVLNMVKAQDGASSKKKAARATAARATAANADTDSDEEESDYMVFSSAFAHLFHRVVCDEGHKLKNPRTDNFAAVETLYAPVIWIVTATPMINRVADLLGYLCLFWNPSWIDDLEELDEWNMPTSPRVRYEDPTLEDFEEKCPNYRDMYQGQPMFLMDPKAFATLLNQGLLGGGHVSHRVLKSILSRIQLRWTMSSQIPVGKDEFFQPGKEVPGYYVAGVELRGTQYEQAEYRKIWRTFNQFLVQGGGTKSTRPSMKPAAAVSGLRDMAVHRHLSLTTFDNRFSTLLVRKADHGALQAASWAEDEGDHGFTEYFYATRPVPSIPNYLDRIEVCHYLVGESPKLRYLCRAVWRSLAGEEANFRGKLTIYVNWPSTQWEVGCLLSNLGIPHFNLWPSTLSSVKDDLLARFNDPDDPVQFLVVNSRSSALGLNIQGACHQILILELPDNINTVIQIIGRVHRLGQTVSQYIWIVCVLGTYDQWLFANATSKMLAQITGEGSMEDITLTSDHKAQMLATLQSPEEVVNVFELLGRFQDHRYIEQAEEYIRVQLGQRCSRLQWKTTNLEDPHQPGTVASNTPIRRHDRGRLVSSLGTSSSLASSDRIQSSDPVRTPFLPPALLTVVGPKPPFGPLSGAAEPSGNDMKREPDTDMADAPPTSDTVAPNDHSGDNAGDQQTDAGVEPATGVEDGGNNGLEDNANNDTGKTLEEPGNLPDQETIIMDNTTKDLGDGDHNPIGELEGQTGHSEGEDGNHGQAGETLGSDSGI